MTRRGGVLWQIRMEAWRLRAAGRAEAAAKVLDTVGLASVEPVRQLKRPRPGQRFFCWRSRLGCSALSGSVAGPAGGLAVGAQPVRAAQRRLTSPDQGMAPGLGSTSAFLCMKPCGCS